MLSSPSVFLGFMRGTTQETEDDGNLIIHETWAHAHASQPLIGVYGEQVQKKGAIQQQLHPVHQIGDDHFVMRGDDPDVQAFQEYDVDNTGVIGMHEVSDALRRRDGREVPPSALMSLVAEMQLDPNGWVTLLEFKHICAHCSSPDLPGNRGSENSKKNLRKKSTVNGDAEAEQVPLRKKSWSALKHGENGDGEDGEDGDGEDALLGSKDEQAILAAFLSYDNSGDGLVSLSKLEAALMKCGVGFNTPKEFRSWLVLHAVPIARAGGTVIAFPKFHALVQTGRQACVVSPSESFSSILTHATGPTGSKKDDDVFTDAQTSKDHDKLVLVYAGTSTTSAMCMLYWYWCDVYAVLVLVRCVCCTGTGAMCMLYAAMLLCCYAAMLLCCYAAMLLCCYAAMLLCCYAAMLLCCYAAMLCTMY
jgi:Ca2+-binding EF-hand superfamily protein